MSATDTQVLAALKDDAWEGHDEPLTSADLERIAKVATEAIGRDADRLRDGIKALIDEWREAAKSALRTADTVSDPYHDARARQRVKTFTDHANTLRALLDGEAKG